MIQKTLNINENEENVVALNRTKDSDWKLTQVDIRNIKMKL